MPQPGGSKAARKDRGRSLPTSPYQRALEPGSQDDLRPENPLNNPRSGEVSGGGELDISPPPPFHSTSLLARACAGNSIETVDFRHDDPAALTAHLEIFLRHNWAGDFVVQFGVDLINTALRELPHAGDLRSPTGWLITRVRNLAKGHSPLPPPLTRSEIERAKHRRTYERHREILAEMERRKIDGEGGGSE